MLQSAERRNRKLARLAADLAGYAAYFAPALLIWLLATLIPSPRHALTAAFAVIVVWCAAWGLVLGLRWDRLLSGRTRGQRRLMSLWCLPIPLIALGGGLASYSGVHDAAYIADGLKQAAAIAVAEYLPFLLGRAIARRRM